MKTPEQKRAADKRYYQKHRQQALAARKRWREEHRKSPSERVHEKVVARAIAVAKRKELTADQMAANIETTRFWWGTGA